jgi:ubiquinone/menaquinone biosynthesis C-methylase UbiE
MMATETARVRAFYDRVANRYDRSMRTFERLLFASSREWLCSRARGDVLEIGIGTGQNLPHYPPGVRLVGIDLSPAMLAIARRRAAELDLPVELHEGNAEALPFGEASFDTVVCGLILCSIPRDRRAIREARRVLRPGGRLLLLEHVRSPVLPVRVGQMLVDPLFVRLESDHLLRDPLDYLEAEGFSLEEVQRLKWGIVERTVARKQGSAT